MKTYQVTRPLTIKGRHYAVSDTIEIHPSDAQFLEASGTIKPKLSKRKHHGKKDIQTQPTD